MKFLKQLYLLHEYLRFHSQLHLDVFEVLSFHQLQLLFAVLFLWLGDDVLTILECVTVR